MALGDFRSAFMPYCVQQQPDGRYAVLNRDYKPVGFWTRAWIAYDLHPVLVKFPGLTGKVAAKLSWNGSTDTKSIYLYNDGCIPTSSAASMDAYLARVARLMKLKIRGTAPTGPDEGERQ